MIAFLSDFGQSEYVGMVKGVIHSLNAASTVIDITHAIAPFSVRQGAWSLLQSYHFFPKNTVFLAIVDPGVGSDRKAIVIETRHYFFVGPDNGILYPAAKEDGIISRIVLSIPKQSSRTFHARDVFAKAAAQLDQGKSTQSLGTKIKDVWHLSFYLKDRGGEIVTIDCFGNIITNLPSLHKKKYHVSSPSINSELAYYDTYNASKENELFLITGSSNTLEISMKEGNASKKMNLNIGDKITIL